MKILVDAFGGDKAPQEIINGAIGALNETGGKFDLVLYGKADVINRHLQNVGHDVEKVSVADADEVINCNESPTEAIRTKKNSSIVRAVTDLKNDPKAAAFVSAGSTGAVLTAAILLSKRVEGVVRPALAPTLPNLKGGETMLLDCGANVDCKPLNLLQFAAMGTAYMREVFRIENPRVALLSNGTEDKKGCALTKEAFELLKKADGINFVGNMEARDILSGEYDVIVADGFCGNIALKSVEGTAKSLFAVLKKEIKSSKKSMIGAMLMKKSFKAVKNMLDYNRKGGAVLLGMEKVVVKAHGSCDAEAFKNAVLQAYYACSLNVNGRIKECVGEVGKGGDN